MGNHRTKWVGFSLPCLITRGCDGGHNHHRMPRGLLGDLQSWWRDSWLQTAQCSCNCPGAPGPLGEGGAAERLLGKRCLMSTLDFTKPLGCLIGVPFLVRNDYCIFFFGVGNLTPTIGLPPQLHVAPASGFGPQFPRAFSHFKL